MLQQSQVKVSLKTIIDALEMASFGNEEFQNYAFVDRETGQVYHYSEYDEQLDSPLLELIPDDLFDNPKYVQLPDKRDLDLGRPLVLDFANRYLGDDANLVYGYFRKRGAYSNFKDLLVRKNLLDQWYSFEKEATEQALKSWCEQNSLELID